MVKFFQFMNLLTNCSSLNIIWHPLQQTGSNQVEWDTLLGKVGHYIMALAKNLNFALCPSVTSCSYSSIAPAILSSVHRFSFHPFLFYCLFLFCIALSLFSSLSLPLCPSPLCKGAILCILKNINLIKNVYSDTLILLIT